MTHPLPPSRPPHVILITAPRTKYSLSSLKNKGATPNGDVKSTASNIKKENETSNGAVNLEEDERARFEVCLSHLQPQSNFSKKP